MPNKRVVVAQKQGCEGATKYEVVAQTKVALDNVSMANVNITVAQKQQWVEMEKGCKEYHKVVRK